MPPKRNYQFEKRQKDLAKQKKKQEKLRKKQERKDAGPTSDDTLSESFDPADGDASESENASGEGDTTGEI